MGRLTAASVAETLFDLSRTMSPITLEGSLDDCLVRNAVTPDELRAVLDRIDGSRLKGTKAFREALQGLSNSYVPTESELERMLFRAINDPRVPSVERQARLPWWPILPHRVDAVIRARRLILEADGRDYHTKRKDFERDRQRDNLAVAHGYRVMRFTYRALSTDPGEVLRLVLDAGEHGSHF
jgi:very-short-patch-repair endonuclease